MLLGLNEKKQVASSIFHCIHRKKKKVNAHDSLFTVTDIGKIQKKKDREDKFMTEAVKGRRQGSFLKFY